MTEVLPQRKVALPQRVQMPENLSEQVQGESSKKERFWKRHPKLTGVVALGATALGVAGGVFAGTQSHENAQSTASEAVAAAKAGDLHSAVTGLAQEKIASKVTNLNSSENNGSYAVRFNLEQYPESGKDSHNKLHKDFEAAVTARGGHLAETNGVRLIALTQTGELDKDRSLKLPDEEYQAGKELKDASEATPASLQVTWAPTGMDKTDVAVYADQVVSTEKDGATQTAEHSTLLGELKFRSGEGGNPGYDFIPADQLTAQNGSQATPDKFIDDFQATE